MTLPGDVGLAAGVLLVVLVIGYLAGRAQHRYALLLAGLVAAVAVGVAVTWTGGVDRASWIAGLLPVVMPLAVAYLGGWLCSRGSLFKRLLVLGVTALLLAVAPYGAVSQLLGGG